MLRFCLLFIFFLTLSVGNLFGQESETLISEDFAIRDFVVSNDSIYYIKKRDAYLIDRNTNAKKSFFIGGYGLKLNTKAFDNSIITVANQLVDTVSSVRFYNKKNKSFEFEFFYKRGKILDFLDIPEASVFVCSLTNKKIIFIDYNTRPEFFKTIEIELNSLCRKLIYKGNILYFATDNGNVYKYNFHNYTKTLLYNTKKHITDFSITKDMLIYTTINGDICKVDLEQKNQININIQNNFISTFTISNNKLICGSWNGTIYIVEIESLELEKELKIHNRAVLKIKTDKNNIYSSSLDKTLKHWKLNK